MATGFYWDEKCFWHAGGDYALTLPLGGLVQPLAAGGLPDSPEAKRRLKNQMEETGLLSELDVRTAPMASRADLERVHPASYLDAFKALSDDNGGEIGYHAPFLKGGYEIAALSAGMALAAVEAVAKGELDNAYSLSRPPGHHCLPDNPNGFCLFNNIAVAVEAALAKGLGNRVAVLDWDVHHGNGTEAIYYDRDDVLTISLHQENNYPPKSGAIDARGKGLGLGHNINVPLFAGSGHTAYMHAMERIVTPALDAFKPDMIIVACGFDAALFDPLASMLATVKNFKLELRKHMPDPNPDALAFLQTRRSRPAKTLRAPWPDQAALEPLLTAAARTPDHGKLEPWRFIVLERAALARLADVAEARGKALGLAPEQVTNGRGQYDQGGLAVAVIEVQKPSEKIPALEQTYSAGAVCLALLNAALAAGWGANWLSGWPSHDRGFMQDGLQLQDHERIAGLIHIGTEGAVPPDRPRPDLQSITTWLSA